MAFIYDETEENNDYNDYHEDKVVFYTRTNDKKVVPVIQYIKRGDSEKLQYYANLYMFPKKCEDNFRQYSHK